MLTVIKNRGISRSDQLLVYLKKRVMVNEWTVLLNINAIKLIMQRTSISGKENVLLKKVILLKKLLFERSACFEKVHVLNNYLFYSSLFSEASACAGKVFIFKKWQIRKSMCYQKVVKTAFRKRTFPKTWSSY